MDEDAGYGVTISFELEKDFNLSSLDIEIIARDYSGDAKAFIFDNWKKYIDFDSVDIEVEKVKLHDAEYIKNSLIEYRLKKKETDKETFLYLADREAVEEDSNSCGFGATPNILKNPVAYLDEINTTKIELSKEERVALNRVSCYTMPHYSSHKGNAMGYILIDGNDVVATDSRRLMVSKLDEARDERLFIPPHFVYLMNKEGFNLLSLELSTTFRGENKDNISDTLYLLVEKEESGEKILLEHKYRNRIFDVSSEPVSTKDLQFPDWKRMLVLVEENSIIEKTLGKDIPFEACDEELNDFFLFLDGIRPVLHGIVLDEIDFTLYDEVRYLDKGVPPTYPIYFSGEKDILILSVIDKSKKER